MTCPFCNTGQERIVFKDEFVFVVRDAFPVNPGHTLIIPHRHIASWFEATPVEQAHVVMMITKVKEDLDREFCPDGYNVGFNDGVAAGQTVMHLHVHIIPRYTGDIEDPAGGIRGVILDKKTY